MLMRDKNVSSPVLWVWHAEISACCRLLQIRVDSMPVVSAEKCTKWKQFIHIVNCDPICKIV